MIDSFDAVVVGSGPNGMAAAITLAEAGVRPVVLEARSRLGGGVRSDSLTEPGFIHDVCSAIHPLAVASPFFKRLPLGSHGLSWIHPSVPAAHPLDDGTAVLLYRSVSATSEGLGVDGLAYRRLMMPFVQHWDELLEGLLAPLRFPRHPWQMARFGFYGMRSAASLAGELFEGERARALFAGMAAHAILPLDKTPSSAFGLVLAVAGHATGWPMPRGGAQGITDALAAHLRSLGGVARTDVFVRDVGDLPKSQVVLFDLSPRGVCEVARNHLPASYLERLSRYRFGPGVFKIDWALHGPIPWKAKECGLAGTVHVGGTFEEIARAERAAFQGQHAEAPMVLVAQPTRFDPSRAPPGKHVAWAYCHVPSGSTVDMTDRIEAQIERFAPGFRDQILARHTMNTAAMEAYNPNYVGGDINGGVQDAGQLFARPVWRIDPYSTPDERFYVCSSSTPPGGGVHGMCGFHAASSALGALSRRSRT